MKKLLLLLILVLPGCGTIDITDIFIDKKLEIHPDLKKYVTKFEKVAKHHNKNIKIDNLILTFADDLGKNDVRNASIIGKCYYEDTPRVVIDEDHFYNSLDGNEKELLVFHELGHCILKRKHLKTKTKKGTPKSIMYPILFSGDTYSYHYKYYMKELFSY